LQKQFLFTGIEGTGFVRNRGMRGRAYENPKTRCNDKQVCKNRFIKASASKGGKPARVWQMKIKFAVRFFGTG
jgi:hypothetical protein